MTSANRDIQQRCSQPASPWASSADEVEHALRDALAYATGRGTPPRLREALAYAVFPGGARLRPRLCLAVTAACGGPRSDRARDVGPPSSRGWPSEAGLAAAAVELVHCASLVHDDLPCFDDADLRRGKEAVHKRFGEPTALLVGDALIVIAFGTLARSSLRGQLELLARATGPSHGIIAGQAWENEPAAPLAEYHRAKTAALFEAAAGMGALAAGCAPEPWRDFGELVGRAYQAADDLADATKAAADTGKTSGRDIARDRPSIVRTRGERGAREELVALLDEARSHLPDCTGKRSILFWLDAFAARVEAA